jgi:hypothetical protein
VELTPAILHIAPIEAKCIMSHILKPNILTATRSWRIRRVMKPGGITGMCVLEVFSAMLSRVVAAPASVGTVIH